MEQFTNKGPNGEFAGWTYLEGNRGSIYNKNGQFEHEIFVSPNRVEIHKPFDGGGLEEVIWQQGPRYGERRDAVGGYLGYTEVRGGVTEIRGPGGEFQGTVG